MYIVLCPEHCAGMFEEADPSDPCPDFPSPWWEAYLPGRNVRRGWDGFSLDG